MQLEKDGYIWYPYNVKFSSPDGAFTFRIWAISDDHAELQCQAIRETASVQGKIVYEE